MDLGFETIGNATLVLLAERLRTAALREPLFIHVFPLALMRAKVRYRRQTTADAEPTLTTGGMQHA